MYLLYPKLTRFNIKIVLYSRRVKLEATSGKHISLQVEYTPYFY